MNKAKTVTVAGTILLGALLFGAPHAAAAPLVPIGPTDIVAPTVPPKPNPCQVKHIPCDLTLPTFDPDLPTDVANPTDVPTTEPSIPTDVTNPPSEPSEPGEPSDPPVTTTTQHPPVEHPKDAPTGVPTPNRIDTGAGPADPSNPSMANWALIVVPALALLALAGAGAFLWIQRSERRPS
jgi:hypothetical protein